MEGGYTLGYKVRNVLRIAYTLPFVLASITGVAYALTLEQEWLMALLIPLDVFVLAMFVNLTNDYYDFRSGADKAGFEVMDAAMSDPANKSLTEKVFWQGNSFDRGLISERTGLILVATWLEWPLRSPSPSSSMVAGWCLYWA